MELKQEHMVGCLGLKPETETLPVSVWYTCVQHDRPASKANVKQSRVPPTQQLHSRSSVLQLPWDLFSINPKRTCRQASYAAQSTPSDLSGLSPRRVHCPPSPAAEQSKMARGARPSARLLLLTLGLVLLYLSSGSSSGFGVAAAQKTWCVAKPSASNDILSLNLNYACSQVSCAVIQKGGPCYYPDNLVSRAAVAMNLYYAANGRHPWNCYFNNSALVVKSDPSYGSCTYY